MQLLLTLILFFLNFVQPQQSTVVATGKSKLVIEVQLPQFTVVATGKSNLARDVQPPQFTVSRYR